MGRKNLNSNVIREKLIKDKTKYNTVYNYDLLN